MAKIEEIGNIKGPRGNGLENPRLMGKNLVVDEVLYTPSGTVVNAKVLGDATGAKGDVGPRGIPGADAMPQAEAAGEWLSADGTPLNAAFHAQLAAATAATGSAFRQQLSAIAPSAPATAQDVYVSLVGSDSNDGLTPSTPVRTLSRAVALVPEVIRLGNVWRLYVAPGDYNETLRIRHRLVEGQILVVGQGSAPSDVRFNQVIVENVKGYIELSNVAVKERFSQAQFWFIGCPDAVVTTCEGMGDPASDITASGRIGFLADMSTNLLIRGNCKATYKRYFARANYNSKIHAADNDPSVDASGVPTNNYGIAARHGGIATIYGTAPAGREGDQSTDTGGIIAAGRGMRYDQSEDGLVEQWTALNSLPLKKTWVFRRKTVPGLSVFDATRRFRATFDSMISTLPGATPQLGCVVIDVEFTAQLSSAQAIHQQKRIVGNITSTAFVLAHQEVIAERVPAGYASDKNTIITAVNQSVRAGRFSIDVIPKIDTMPDAWRVDISVSHVGTEGAPKLVSVA